MARKLNEGMDQTLDRQKELWYLLPDGLKHYPEFFLIQPSRFSGRKIVTLCKKVEINFEGTVIGSKKCPVCEADLRKKVVHNPKELKI